VSFAAEANAVVTAGWSVTVTGISFAPLTETPSARVGLSSCGTTSWASGTAVVCLLAQGYGTAATVTATVAGVVGTRTALFSFDGAQRTPNAGVLELMRRA
jgi:hypothetical protein